MIVSELHRLEKNPFWTIYTFGNKFLINYKSKRHLFTAEKLSLACPKYLLPFLLRFIQVAFVIISAETGILILERRPLLSQRSIEEIHPCHRSRESHLSQCFSLSQPFSLSVFLSLSQSFSLFKTKQIALEHLHSKECLLKAKQSKLNERRE